MNRIISQLFLLGLLALSVNGFAAKTGVEEGAGPAVGSRAQPNSTQLVIVMNALANSRSTITQSSVEVKFYDGKGPCWNSTLRYHEDPFVGGAGGHNGCNYNNSAPPGIVKMDIIPQPITVSLGQSLAAGQVLYEPLNNVSIQTDTFYNTIIITQDRSPVFNSDGNLIKKGTIKVIKFSEQGEDK